MLAFLLLLVAAAPTSFGTPTHGSSERAIQGDATVNLLYRKLAITLPKPAQDNVDHDSEHIRTPRDGAATPQEPAIAKTIPAETTTKEGDDNAIAQAADVTETEVAPGELEHEEPAVPVMSRSETQDSVVIIGDVLA